MLYFGQHTLATIAVYIANVDFELHPAGHAVHCGRENVAYPGGGDGIDGSGGFGCSLHCEDQFSSSAQSIATVRHQHGTSVASFAFDGYAQTCWSGDGRNNANGELFPFQNRALLDVQLDEAIVVSGRDAHVGKISYESGFAADLLQCLAALIAKRLIDGHIEATCQQSAP